MSLARSTLLGLSSTHSRGGSCVWPSSGRRSFPRVVEIEPDEDIDYDADDAYDATPGPDQPQTQLQYAIARVRYGFDRRARLLFLVSVLALVSIGTIMIFSASAKVAMESDAIGDPAHFLKKHCLFLGVGLILCAIALQVPYDLYRRHAKWLYIGAMALLFVVLIPGIGSEFNGARRWFRFGFIGFQPSDAAKIVLILACAAFAVERRHHLHSFMRGFVPAVAMVAAMALLILLEPDFGTALFCTAVGMSVLLLGGVRVRHLLPVLLALLPLVCLVVVLKFDHVRPRIETFLDPGADPEGKGYQINQSLIALGAGGVDGVGLGQSRQALYYLPESETDFIFAIVGEELGFVGTTFVLALFVLLILSGMRLAMRAPDRYGRLVTSGVVLAIGLQAMINVAVVTASVPTKGISLPFISFGGSLTVFYLIGVGIVLNIASKIAPPVAPLAPPARRAERVDVESDEAEDDDQSENDDDERNDERNDERDDADGDSDGGSTALEASDGLPLQSPRWRARLAQMTGWVQRRLTPPRIAYETPITDTDQATLTLEPQFADTSNENPDTTSSTADHTHHPVMATNSQRMRAPSNSLAGAITAAKSQSSRRLPFLRKRNSSRRAPVVHGSVLAATEDGFEYDVIVDLSNSTSTTSTPRPLRRDADAPITDAGVSPDATTALDSSARAAEAVTTTPLGRRMTTALESVATATGNVIIAALTGGWRIRNSDDDVPLARPAARPSRRLSAALGTAAGTLKPSEVDRDWPVTADG